MWEPELCRFNASSEHCATILPFELRSEKFVVKDICLLGCGRWSAIIREADPGMYSPADYYLHVRVSCGGECFAEYGMRSAMKPLYEKPRDEDRDREAFIEHARLLDIKVTAGDLANARFLIGVGDKLCFHILGGGSVKDWCAGVGLTPVAEWKVPRDRKRPCAITITDGDSFFILSRTILQRKDTAQKPCST